MSLAVLRLPTDADILTLESPAFDAAPPDIRNRDLIPDNILQAMVPAWSVARFSARAIRAVRLDDVWVAKEGLVFTADGGGLYQETITQHSPDEIAAAHGAVLAAIAAGAPVDQGGPVVLCKKRGVGNYGHWLMEMLPKAYIAISHLSGLDLRLLVAAAPDRLGAAMAQSLDMLGISPDRVVVADDAPRRFAELIVMDGISEHGGYMSPWAPDAVTAMARRVEPAPPCKLFITRQSVGFRRLVDEDILLARAQAYGYTPVDPNLLSLDRQIALFKGAAAVVGVMGAALTNLAFAPAGCRAIIIAPAGMPDTFFWFIAGLRGLSYTEIRCPQTGPIRGNAPWDTDLILPPEDAAFILQA